MDAPLFFAPPQNRDGDLIHLPAEEVRHVKVLRLCPGALVVVIDGLGTAWRAELLAGKADRATARIHSEVRQFGEPRVRLTLAAGLSTGSKFDAVVEKGTELGVSRFVPLITERSKVEIEDARRARLRANRLARVALAATKQCRRSVVPEVALPTRFRDFLKQHDPAFPALVFHPGRTGRPLTSVSLPDGAARITLLIGPESGFTEIEVEAAERIGFVPVSLGSRILRTETAGPVAVALVMSRLGELS